MMCRLYGVSREGYASWKKRVARIMRENGLVAKRAKIYRKTPGLMHFISTVPNRELSVLAERGVIQSMNRPRRMNDNAHMESFFANFKAERIHREPEARTEAALRRTVEEYIDFYDNERTHSSIGYVSPSEYEKMAA